VLPVLKVFKERLAPKERQALPVLKVSKDK
jgi:hypothetical protein